MHLNNASSVLDKSLLTVDYSVPYKPAKERLLEAFETDYWTGLLRITGGNVSETARRAGVHRKSVEYAMKKLGLER